MKLKDDKIQISLKRDIDLWEAIIYGVGVILGAGIYALIGKVVGYAGNASWLAFLIAAIVGLLTGLSYCELSSKFPEAGAEYVWIDRTFNRKIFSFVVGWILIFSEIFSVCTVAIGFGGYLTGLLNLEIYNLMPVIFGLILIGILTVINFAGIQESANVNIIFTIIEAGGLIFIISLGITSLGNVNYLNLMGGWTMIGISNLISSIAIIFFAFVGFEDMANISEETKNPRKTIPKALLISLMICTILYILVSLTTVSMIAANPSLSLANFAASAEPLAYLFEGIPAAAIAMSIIALFATANTVLVMLIVTSRMVYGLSDENAFPDIFKKIYKKTDTPWVAIIFVTILSASFIFLQQIQLLAEATVFMIFLIFGIVNITLIVLRYKQRNQERKKGEFRIPINFKWFPIIPLIGAFTCFFMLFNYWKPENWIILPINIILIIVGIIIYFIFTWINKKEQKNDIGE
ncbi:MAG: amino acid permease [Candidatus Lokiarchaeota archaeon]|nr:amino acid permease [Candidatus Lokiarchaeota archaeon]